MTLPGRQQSLPSTASPALADDICAACQRSNPPGSIICGQCASTLITLFCPLCGTRNDPGVRYCLSCGGSFVPNSITAALALAQQTAPTTSMTAAGAPTVAWRSAGSMPQPSPIPVWQSSQAAGAPAVRARRRRLPVAATGIIVLTILALALSFVLPPVGLALSRAYRLFGLIGQRIGAFCLVAAMLGMCTILGLVLLAPDTVAAALGHAGTANPGLTSITQTFHDVAGIIQQVAAALRGG